jgi:SNF2 family DNA or RNA helicase
MVYRLIAKDTIEEKVMALQARKAALFANVIDAGTCSARAWTPTTSARFSLSTHLRL